jgi:hypothetical protein
MGRDVKTRPTWHVRLISKNILEIRTIEPDLKFHIKGLVTTSWLVFQALRKPTVVLHLLSVLLRCFELLAAGVCGLTGT